MATTVGTESTLGDLLRDLIRLEYDAVGAYVAAIDGVTSLTCQSALMRFKRDHQRHIAEVGEHLAGMSRAPVTQGDVKRLLARGMAPLAGVCGDAVILQMLKTHEDDANAAYRRAVHFKDTPPQVHKALEQGCNDARHHRDWIAETIKSL